MHSAEMDPATTNMNPSRNGSDSSDCEKPQKTVGFDWIISNRLGEFGKYQKGVYLLLGLPAISCALHALSWVFTGANVNYRCQLFGEHESNASFSHLPPGRTFNDSFPWEINRAGSGRFSRCEKFDETEFYGDNVASTHLPFMSTHAPGLQSSTGSFVKSKVNCDGKYVYDDSQYKTSARTDFKLICGNTYWYTIAETLFKSGILVGAFVFGNLSDRFGRRPVFFYALCQQVTCGIIAAVAPNYTVFVAARFLTGMANSGVFLVAFVIAMELVGKGKRVVAGICLQYFFSVGYLVVGILAFYIREWRYLQLAISLPGLLYLSYYCILPESIRWLLINGKREEAVKILKTAAKINGVEIPECELAQLNENKSTGGSFKLLEIMRYPRTAMRSVNIFFCWFVSSGVYYGLALNSGNLGGNDYVNFILSGAVEVPAYAMLLLTLNRLGRRLILCGCMILSGIFLVVCGFIPAEMTWLLVTLNMLGKLFNAAAYAVIYMFACELFPTEIRNSAMGISSVMARVGGILSDYVILSQLVWKPLPHLIFGGVSLTSGLLTLLLPETMEKRLPETLEDSEAFGTDAYDNSRIAYASDGLKSRPSDRESRF